MGSDSTHPESRGYGLGTGGNQEEPWIIRIEGQIPWPERTEVKIPIHIVLYKKRVVFLGQGNQFFFCVFVHGYACGILNIGLGNDLSIQTLYIHN